MQKVKEWLMIAVMIIIFLLLIADIFFPIIIAFWTGNFWLLFLYAVWWLPIIFGFIFVKFFIEEIL